MTSACPPSIVAATTEFVVPRSMPTALAMSAPLGSRARLHVLPRALARHSSAARPDRALLVFDGGGLVRGCYRRLSQPQRSGHGSPRTTTTSVSPQPHAALGAVPRARAAAGAHGPADAERVVTGRGGNGGVWMPVTDIEETDDAWVIEAELPGVDRKDVNVELRDSELIISGEIKEKERKGVLRRQTPQDRRVRVPRHAPRRGRRGAHRGETPRRRPDGARAQDRAGQAAPDRGQGGVAWRARASRGASPLIRAGAASASRSSGSCRSATSRRRSRSQPGLRTRRWTISAGPTSACSTSIASG